MVKNKILIKFIVILLGFSNLSAQESAVDLLEKVNKNVLSLDNVYYKFKISSKFENNILPISGEFYIKQESYLIDTNEIDQIYDGEKFYTIIHENKEIIISTENTSFFNFSPNQIFNFFLKGFDLKRQNISNDKYFIAAESIEEEEIIYKITKKFKFWKWRISYEIETKKGKKLVLISDNKQNSIFKLQLNDSNFEVKIHYFDKKSIFKNGVKIAEIDESFFSSKEKNISSVLLSNKEDLELIFLIFSCLKTGETHQKPVMKSQKEWISIKEEWSS